MNKSSIIFIIILVFILGLVLGSLAISVSLSSNTNHKAYTIKIDDFVSIKIYTNSFYDLFKIRQFVADMEDFTYTDGNMIVLADMISERFRSVVNIRYLKSDGTYTDYRE